ncbi:MAG: adenosine deaminase, partial [Bryobacteraceae bacterium]
MSRFRDVLLCITLVAAFAAGATGRAQNASATTPQDGARAAAHAYDAAVREGSPALRAFLTEFPKGADLHVHLSGAVYAETFIREAAEDGLCVDRVALALEKPPCGDKQIPAKELTGNITAADQDLYDKLIDSLSMRSFVPYAGWSGHDQFFATFGKFGGLKNHTAEWVDEVASRSAAQNQQYLELMETPAFGHAAQIAHTLGWNAELARGGRDALERFRQQLLEHGVRDEVAADREEVRQAEAERRRLEHCGTAQAMPACQVEVRFIYQVLRGYAPEQVFAQTLLGFETVKASIEAGKTPEGGGFVGINFVMPEDGLI